MNTMRIKRTTKMWDELFEKAALAALTGLLANPDDGDRTVDTTAKMAVVQATAFISFMRDFQDAVNEEGR
jgi:hypothetical protein